MGGLPQPAFNYLYHSATLPCIFEGKGTANSVLNYGRSYLQLNDKTNIDHPTAFTFKVPKKPKPEKVRILLPLYPTVPLTAQGNCQKAVDSFKSTVQLRTGLVAWNKLLQQNKNDDLPSTQIGSFIIDSTTDKNALAKYFKDLGKFFHAEVNDKLLNALFYMMSQRLI